MITFSEHQPMNSDGGTLPDIVAVSFDMAFDAVLVKYTEAMRAKFMAYDFHTVYLCNKDESYCCLACMN